MRVQSDKVPQVYVIVDWRFHSALIISYFYKTSLTLRQTQDNKRINMINYMHSYFKGFYES